jgi:hypothetical protein
MKRCFIATIVGLTVFAMVPTSPSAFRCLARSSNGAATWGYGVLFWKSQDIRPAALYSPGGN